jgi:anti-anti-sigma factor
MSADESSPSSSFTWSVVPNRSEVAVVAAGELDLASADDVQQVVRQLERVGFNQIVLDLHGVNFIDSSGSEC